ncbi:MAG: host-nuclease inhibitor Gam family protein [Candidatus Brocadiaceae bacterium]|jgi:phage host-nuclease inhibitor protein Gam
MSERPRRKPDPRTAVSRKLRKIHRVHQRLASLRADLERELQEARERYQARIAAGERRLRRLKGELEDFCRRRRHSIVPEGRKSLETPFGRVGFRRGRTSVRRSEDITQREVCRRLREAGLPELIRLKERPDRRAIGRALREGDLDRALLQSCGLRVVEARDRFHCKVHSDALVEAGR